jgi:hypothetical protein
MLIGGMLAAQGRETRVWAVMDKTGRLRPKPMPEEVTARFRMD